MVLQCPQGIIYIVFNKCSGQHEYCGNTGVFIYNTRAIDMDNNLVTSYSYKAKFIQGFLRDKKTDLFFIFLLSYLIDFYH